ncbi:FecR domain-containing protein [Terrimonas sp. NA20]|uniref:FecR domain-containing protein n=1 Tax=Terrimonas ginsenosidimutans TaxID=2908004 RepID=A0ABS9KRM7_9BACT|nr:FecR family protein [Terrimonas ginsenosidimutans]MCG2614964.1 FecR domain-containing protein [Terrimonas ginsenosidimutans]
MTRLTELINKCLEQTATDAERAELTALLNDANLTEDSLSALRQAFIQKKELLPLPETNADSIVSAILEGVAGANADMDSQEEEQPPRYRLIWRWAAAASVLLLLSLGGYWFVNHSIQRSNPQANVTIQPGRDGAILTLADGSQVVLDSLADGVVAVQQGTDVLLKNGELVYDKENAASEPAINIMSTPKGRQFNITLPDGTRVWLNAASSLKFPTAFTGKERRVEITGEAYFEVAKDKTKPFFVTLPNQSAIEVLGTSFNVNAYTEEKNIQATLLEGSMRLHANTHEEERTALLKPGQQASIPSNTNARDIALDKADIDKVMAWRNGFFHLEGVTLKDAMTQFSRWYDIDVVYDKEVKHTELQQITLAGEIRRDLNLEAVLDLLKELDLHFKVEGRRLTVLP